MARLQSLSREQLVQLLTSRDEEIATLKAMNREATTRLQDVEQSLVTFMERFSTLDSHDSSLRQRLHNAETGLQASLNGLQELERQRESLEQRNVDLEEELEHQIFWRRRFFPYLGLKVAPDSSGSSVEVVELRDPAKGGGIDVGDVITHISFTGQRIIRTVADYQRVISDLPAESTATVEILRRGKKYVVQLQPSIGTYR